MLRGLGCRVVSHQLGMTHVFLGFLVAALATFAERGVYAATGNGTETRQVGGFVAGSK